MISGLPVKKPSAYKLMFPCESFATKAIFGSLPPTMVGVTVGVDVGEGVSVKVGEGTREGVSVDVGGTTVAVGIDFADAAHAVNKHVTRRKTHFFILSFFLGYSVVHR